VEAEDIDIMFATACWPIPNKPRTAALEEVSKAFVSTNRIYLDASKRSRLEKAMQPALLKARKEELFRILQDVRISVTLVPGD